jgi:hypothetical protein
MHIAWQKINGKFKLTQEQFLDARSLCVNKSNAVK